MPRCKKELRFIAVRSLQRIVELEDFIEGNGILLGSVDTDLAPPVSASSPERLTNTVTGDKGALLRVAHTHTETAGNIGGKVEGGVVQQLVRNLDHSAQLVRRQHGLTEGGIAFGDLLALIDPACLTGILRDRDLGCRSWCG